MHGALEQIKQKMGLWSRRSTGGSGNAMFEAFQFIDIDNNGVLGKEELCDAFSALGVYISDETMEKLVEYVDKDGNGIVDYKEFSRCFFPGI